jgi:opacity protein-like surface antigen
MSALALASFIAAPGVAQGVRAQVGVAGSVTFPTSFYHADPNGDGFTPAVYGFVLVDLKLPKTPVGLRLDLSTGHNSANDSLKARLSAAVGAPSDGKTSLLGGTVDVTYNLQPASKVRGYLLGGIGLYRVKFSVTSNGVTADTSVTKFAWNVGAGFTYGTGVIAPFLEARYLDVGALQTIKPTTLSTAVGIRLRIGS